MEIDYTLWLQEQTSQMSVGYWLTTWFEYADTCYHEILPELLVIYHKMHG